MSLYCSIVAKDIYWTIAFRSISYLNLLDSKTFINLHITIHLHFFLVSQWYIWNSAYYNLFLILLTTRPWVPCILGPEFVQTQIFIFSTTIYTRLGCYIQLLSDLVPFGWMVCGGKRIFVCTKMVLQWKIKVNIYKTYV